MTRASVPNRRATARDVYCRLLLALVLVCSAPAQAQRLFSDDYSSPSNLIGGWDSLHAAAFTRFQVVFDSTLQRNVRSFTVEASDSIERDATTGECKPGAKGKTIKWKKGGGCFNSTCDGPPDNKGESRAEVLWSDQRYNPPGFDLEGEEHWIRWRTKWPSGNGYPTLTTWQDGDFQVFTQFKHSADQGSPPVAFDVVKDKSASKFSSDAIIPGGCCSGEWIVLDVRHPVLETAYSYPIAPLSRGGWHHFSVNVKWMRNATGFVRVWYDSDPFGPPTVEAKRTNMITGSRYNYIKQGLYQREGRPCGNDNKTRTVLHESFKVGWSLEDVLDDNESGMYDLFIPVVNSTGSLRGLDFY